MKRFEWRLQRLLDIKIKQEDAKRAELVAVTEQAAVVRGQIMLKKAMLRQMLAELSGREIRQRLSDQELFLRHAHIFDRKIKELKDKQKELEKLRRIKIGEMLEIRKSRKGLEKLRVKAEFEFMSEQYKREQDELDDNTSIRYARELIDAF